MPLPPGATSGSALPPPKSLREVHPALPFAMTALVSIVAGATVGLLSAGTGLFVYLFYNAFLGLAIGATLARASSEGRFIGRQVLGTVCVLATLIAYLAYHIAAFWMSDPQVAGVPLAALPWDARVAVFFEWLGQQLDHPLPGIGRNAAIQSVLWIGGWLITFWIAWQRVRDAMLLAMVGRVPLEVFELTLDLLLAEQSDGQIREVLARRGWDHQTDQDAAIQAAEAYRELVRRQV
jgi:hypothetical protein